MKKSFLILSILLIAGMVFAGAKTEKAETETAAVEMVKGKYNEAPMLAELVRKGELPPVDERLPVEPLVVVPFEEVGQYGGIWRKAHSDTQKGVLMWYNTFVSSLRYAPDFKSYAPSAYKDYELSNENKTITFYLREGMKWSDGAPFTTDDVMFWWEDLNLNEEYTPSVSGNYKINGEVMELTQIDDYTYTIDFASPYGGFIRIISGHSGSGIMFQPKEYLKQFHPKYASEADLKAAMDKEGFTSWPDLMRGKTDHNEPGTPQHRGWIPMNKVDAPVAQWVRNPYFWKVDTAGNQLPYIDEIQITLVADWEAVLLKGLAGDIDMQHQGIANAQNYSTVVDNMEKGDYRIVPIGSLAISNTLWLNFFHEDKVLGDLFRDKRFRIALSLAIDREEINDIVYLGAGRIVQCTCAEEMPWYDETLARQWTEFDPDRANELLDEMGLEWDANHEYRLRPDGKRISIVMSPFGGHHDDYGEGAELIKKTWAQIGVEAINNPIGDQLWYTRITSSEFDVSFYAGACGSIELEPLGSVWLFPLSQYSYWGVKWGIWYQTEGESGEEPPEDVKKIYELWQQLKATGSMDEYNRLMAEVMDIRLNNLWEINIVEFPDIGYFYIVRNNMRNVPDKVYRNLTFFHPESFFFKN